MSETSFRIEGGHSLYGEVTAQHAKNAVLPMIAAALIPEQGETILHEVPNLKDIHQAFDALRHIGAKVTYDPATRIAQINAEQLNTGILPAEITTRFRGSVLLLAPLLLRLGYVELPGSGGCNIGLRKIDYHHRGFARLGAKVIYHEDGTTVIKQESKGLTGTLIYLDFPSHTGTENLMMGASIAQGYTIIENASVEPEVLDFGNYLNQMGAKIEGLGTHTLYIEGVKKLQPIEYTPMPDRLDTGTFLMAVSIAGGDVIINNCRPDHLRLLNAKLEQMGIEIQVLDHATLRIKRDLNKTLNPINITTHPYPGFPTDLQPCMAALSTKTKGISYIRETIFENRYDFTDGLISMGADILISQSDVCVITGVKQLRGAHVKAESIRAGAAVLIASLGANGTTIIDNIYQIDRGHEYIEDRLNALGADITRIEKIPSPSY
ncbi:UDP-N-acetylglucosamine 1-carboxyvinyltransferase [Anaerolineales bacterium]